MTKDVKKEAGFWKRWKAHYRLQLIDMQTYDVKWVLNLSRLNILSLTSILLLAFLFLSFLIIALTPLRFLLPGFAGSTAEEKRALVELKLQADKMESQLNSYRQYVDNFRMIIKDSFPEHEDYKEERTRIFKADPDIFFPPVGRLETQFRKDFELLLKKDDAFDKTGRAYLLSSMQKPLEGKIALEADGQSAGSRTLVIKGAADAAITAILPGVVVAKYKVSDDTHLYIQHEESILSAYRFQGTAVVANGERIDIGQLIGVIAEDGPHLLMLDIWSNTEPLPVGQYLIY